MADPNQKPTQPPNPKKAPSIKSNSAVSIADTFRTFRTAGSALKKATTLVAEKAQDHLAKVAGVSDENDDVKARLKALRTKLNDSTAPVLQRTEEPSADREFQSKAAALTSLKTKITSFLDKHDKVGFYKATAEADAIKARIAGYEEELRTCLESFGMNVIVSLYVQSSEDRRSRTPSPLPTAPKKEFHRPPSPRVFVGRIALFSSLLSLLAPPSPAPALPGAPPTPTQPQAPPQAVRIALLGPGGIGKTTLALSLLHAPSVVAHYGQNRAFVSCEGCTSSSGFLKSAASSLRLPLSGDLKQTVTDQLKSLQGPVLLVLDNLESAWDSAADQDIESLLEEWAGVEGLSLLVTVRGGVTPPVVDWTRTEHVGPLDEKEGRELFDQISGKGPRVLVERAPGVERADDKAAKEEREERAVQALLSEMDGMPRPIVILSSLIQSTSPVDLLASYREAGTRILQKGRGDRDSSFNKSTVLSLECTSMRQHPSALEVFRLIALLPDGAERGQLEEMLPSMNGRQEAAAGARVLLQLALVDEVEGGVLRVLAPIRRFMLDCYPAKQAKHWEEFARYYTGLAGSGEHAGRKEGADPVRRLGREFRNVQVVLRYAFETELPKATVAEAVVEFVRFCFVARFGECEGLVRLALEQVAENREMTRQKAPLLLALGRFQTRREKYEEAAESLHEARELFKESHQDVYVSDCQLALADNHCAQGELDDACLLIRGVETRVFVDTDDDTLGQAQCRHRLGVVLRQKGEVDDARKAFTRATELYEQEGYDLGVAEISWELAGILAMEKEKRRETMKMLMKTKEYYEQIGFVKMIDACQREMRRVEDDQPMVGLPGHVVA